MTKINPMPQEARQLAALETRLGAKDLTTQQIRDLADEIILTTEKTSQSAQPLFDRLEQAMNGLVERKTTLSQEVLEIAKKIDQLDIQWNTLSPEQIAEELVDLNARASLISGEDEATPFLKNITAQARKQLEHLNFGFVFPSVKELDSESMEATFGSRMHQIAERMRQQTSMQPFHTLELAQQREVMRYISKEGV